MKIEPANTLRWREILRFDMLPTVAVGILGILFAFEAITPFLTLAGTVVFTNIEVLLALVVAIWAVALLKARRRPELPLLVIVPALGWCGVLLASTISATGPVMLPLRFVARMVAGVCIGWMCYDTVSTSRHPTWIACCLAIGGALVAALGLAEAFNLPVLASWLTNFKSAPTKVGDILRISSTLSYATITSMVLELTFPLLLAWFISAKRFAARIALGGLGLLCLAVMVSTLSRAGMIALTAALGVVLAAAAVTKSRRIAVTAEGAIGALGVLAILSLASNPETSLRLTSESDQSWYNGSISVADHITARPGASLTVPVSISNLGVKNWGVDPVHPYALGYHLYASDRSLVTYDGARTPLASGIAPGAVVQVDAILVAPDKPATYDVQWDLVQNGVTWFSWKGSRVTSSTLVVSGSASAGPGVNYVPPPSEILTLPVPGRLQLWSTGLAMLVDHPLLGVGPDNFRWQYGSYAHVSRWNTDIHANNLYVELLADTGLLGLLVFAWLVWRIFGQSTQGLAAQPPGRFWIWRVAALASLTAWFVHGLFDYFYEFTPTYVAFWLIVGLALGLAKREIDEGANAGANADRI